MKFSPAREMFPKHFSQLFDSMLNERESNSPSFFQPRTDIIERDDRFELVVSLPGMKKEEIKIELKNSNLLISGERKFNREENNARYHKVENVYGSFSRSFVIPETVKSDAIEARYEDGILYLALPKQEERSSSIEIK